MSSAFQADAFQADAFQQAAVPIILFSGGWRKPMPYIDEPTVFHLTGPQAVEDTELLRKAVFASMTEFEDEWLLGLRDLAEVL